MTGSFMTGEDGFDHDLSDLRKVMAGIIGDSDAERRKMMRALHVQHVWEEVAPEFILDHTDKVYVLRDRAHGTARMVVYVDSSQLAAELTAQKWRFKVAVEKELDEGPLDDIRFIPSSSLYEKTVFSKHHEEQENRDKVPSIPLTEEERAVIEEEAAGVTNEELRKALIRARTADMEWKKGIESSKGR